LNDANLLAPVIDCLEGFRGSCRFTHYYHSTSHIKAMKFILATMNPPFIIPKSAFARPFLALIVTALPLAFLPGCADQPPSAPNASWATPVGVEMNPLNHGELH